VLADESLGRNALGRRWLRRGWVFRLGRRCFLRCEFSSLYLSLDLTTLYSCLSASLLIQDIPILGYLFSWIKNYCTTSPSLSSPFHASLPALRSLTKSNNNPNNPHRPFDKNRLSVTLYLHPEGADITRFLCRWMDRYFNPLYSCYGVHELCVRRKGSSLQFRRLSGSREYSKIWMALFFKTWERKCVFCFLKWENGEGVRGGLIEGGG
jgi:hypothetical protein